MSNTIATALREYGQAIRGDWSEIDGRSVLYNLETIADAVEGDNPYTDYTIEEWRDYLGICHNGNGHWVFYCRNDECYDD